MNWICIDDVCCSCKYSFRPLHQFCIIYADTAAAAAATATPTLRCCCFCYLVCIYHFSISKNRRDTAESTLHTHCIDFWSYWSFCHFGHSQKWTGNREIYLTLGIVWKWIFIEPVCVCVQIVLYSVHVYQMKMGTWTTHATTREERIDA